MVAIESEIDTIHAIVKADASVRPGVISMTHGWGGLPGEAERADSGASTCRLIASDRAVETINAMPRMSAIPVRVRGLGESRSLMDS